MSSVLDEWEEYKNDTRMPCRYGVKCYQKNSAHQRQYKHPPKNGKRKINEKLEPAKKLKLEKKDSKGKIPNESDKREGDNSSSGDEDDEKGNAKKECVSDSCSESEDEKSEQNQDKSNETNNKEEDKKIERVSESSSDSEEEKRVETEEKSSHKPFDPKLFIKAKFLVGMPSDFYDFWEFCKELKPNNPSDAFKDIGLKLVGAYDVLAGKFKHVKKPPDEYLRHWRFYYDPPELHTVLKGDDATGYHIGYFFDSPKEPPSLLVSNHGTKDGVFTKMGDNIFAALSLYMEEVKKVGDPFKKMQVGRFLSLVKNKAEKLKLNLSSHSQKIKERETKVIAKTFNKIGLVVPYNKKTQLGYRDLAMSDKDLMTLLNRLDKAAPEQKDKYLSDLQPVLTYANIAIDECDFGTGIKLGWELLFHGIDSLNSTIIQFLSNSYKLLNRDAFAKIAEAHLSKRKKGFDLSIV